MSQHEDEISFKIELPKLEAQHKKDDDDKHFQQKEILYKKRLDEVNYLAQVFNQSLAGWKMQKTESGLVYENKNDVIRIEINHEGKLAGLSGKPPEKLAELAAQYAKTHPHSKLHLSTRTLEGAKEALAEFAKHGGNLDQVAGLTIGGVQNNEKLKELIEELKKQQDLKPNTQKLR